MQLQKQIEDNVNIHLSLINMSKDINLITDIMLKNKGVVELLFCGNEVQPQMPNLSAEY